MTKAFTLTVIIQVLRKKTIFFQKSKFCTFREILTFQSRSTDGKRSNSKPNASVKLDIINWQSVIKNAQLQIWVNDLPSIFTYG